MLKSGISYSPNMPLENPATRRSVSAWYAAQRSVALYSIKLWCLTILHRISDSSSESAISSSAPAGRVYCQSKTAPSLLTVYMVSWSFENHAPTTACLWPDRTVGVKPSTGFRLHILVVRSFEALRKNLESLDHSICLTSSKWPVCVWCLTKGANSTSPSGWASGVEGTCQTSSFFPRPTAKYRPEGEKARAVTDARKEKWYRAMRRGTFVKIACPSSSTERRRLPRGVKPSVEMFLRWANGRVYDLLLCL